MKGVTLDIGLVHPLTKVVSHGVNEPIQLLAAEVCCLADIPIQHLEPHSGRYGKIAIGYRRQSAIRHEFNPVLYALETAGHTFNFLRVIDGIQNATYVMDRQLFFLDKENKEMSDFTKKLVADSKTASPDEARLIEEKLTFAESWAQKIENTQNSLESLLKSLKHIQAGVVSSIAYAKTFDESQFDSIYCEREWRALKEFNFSYDDIAMIVVPQKDGYYNRFIKEIRQLTKDSVIDFPDHIPIVPWEDLVEH